MVGDPTIKISRKDKSTVPATMTKTPLVTVVVSCVILSLPLSLISHGFSLFLLCLSAFLVEIRAKTSPFLLSRFCSRLSSILLKSISYIIITCNEIQDLVKFYNGRRGASSGILLGAVTLPSVMLSKLYSLHDPSQFMKMVISHTILKIGL